MENSNKRKEIIKNVAIIFLIVLLVLTYFSNTIMNYTLPQVSTVYATQGTISERIRGSGSVEPAEKYEVKLDTTREIEEVLIHKGDTIKAGDKLFTLSEIEDSDDGTSKLSKAKTDLETAQNDLDAAEITLDDLKFAYRKALGTQSSETNSYYADLLDIESAKDELAELQKKLDDAKNGTADPLTYSSQSYELQKARDELDRLKDQLTLVKAGKDPYNEANTRYLGLKEELDDLKRSKEKYTNMITSVDTDDMLDLTDGVYERMKNAKQNVTDAQKALDKADEDYKKIVEENSNYTDQNEAIQKKSTEIKNNRDKVASLNREMSELSVLYTDLEAYTSKAASLSSQITELNAQYNVLQDEINDLYQKNAKSKQAKDKIDNANKKLKKAKKNLETAQAELAELKRQIKVSAKKRINELDDEIYEKEKEVNTAEAAKNEASSMQSGLTTEAGVEAKIKDQEIKIKELESTVGSDTKKSISELESKVREQQKKIRGLENDLEKKRATAGTDAATKEFELLDKKREVEKQEAKVEKAKEKVKTAEEKLKTITDKLNTANDVLAKKGGIVDSVSVTIGSKAEAGNVICVISVIDLGYVVEFPVKNEQARKLRIGDNAEITSWYFGDDFSATLKEIKPDSTNPQTQKTLVFSVSGSGITSGDNISLSIGSKGQQYPTVLPNAAIRDGMNGKYVLALESKPSPLGNRYTAVRYDVNVTAKDDNNSAVEGLMGNEYIITTANKPIAPGEQVRPSSNE
ncbi:MAG: hypothetical protein II782_10385 [Oscillospiraceae bacterium]|nr:hypothetical protein [Oscillospiraceae bacterium]